MTADPETPSGRTPESLPEGSTDAGKDIAQDGRSTDPGELQGDAAIDEDEFGDGI